jgi:hypothetical protein
MCAWSLDLRVGNRSKLHRPSCRPSGWMVRPWHITIGNMLWLHFVTSIITEIFILCKIFFFSCYFCWDPIHHPRSSSSFTMFGRLPISSVWLLECGFKESHLLPQNRTHCKWRTSSTKFNEKSNKWFVYMFCFVWLYYFWWFQVPIL